MNPDTDPRTIVVLGGGGFSVGRRSPIDNHILSIPRVVLPRICFLPTASGDREGYIDLFEAAFTPDIAEPSVLTLFKRQPGLDPAAHLLRQDIIYVGGGNTANALAVWRLHGVDIALRQAWERGTVLCGVSAGMICWFQAGITDSFGDLAPLHDGLAILPGSACPHFDGEPGRPAAYHDAIRNGLAPGIAADDDAAAVFRGTELVDAIAEREGAGVYRVGPAGDEITNAPIPTRLLSP